MDVRGPARCRRSQATPAVTPLLRHRWRSRGPAAKPELTGDERNRRGWRQEDDQPDHDVDHPLPEVQDGVQRGDEGCRRLPAQDTWRCGWDGRHLHGDVDTARCALRVEILCPTFKTVELPLNVRQFPL